MPSRNRIKEYHKDSYYHIYNRGVEKRPIFRDSQDYSVFLSYLQGYLLPKDEESLNKILVDWRSSPEEKEKARKLLKLNNFSDEITLLAYCLMPNHFHFLIHQNSAGAMDKFMNSVYKAKLIHTDEQLLIISRYIHKQASTNPSLSGSGQPSSYQVFIGDTKPNWVHPEEILAYLTKNYPSFTYKTLLQEESDWDLIHNFTLDD
ncbi:MAG: hypothetical protein UV33_C0018G0005 [Candidatus Daviesbacteria bacterium GW2011_GWA1_42_6]|uniref:Transposase IS200-like domain-containing protein n=1 Tax=Candidatus Daviesbacteria bacterium GW2011_GWA1_42_6 TaxID=1618420 RepID=A0A0G1D1M0_9BACT|nr:MAG: hypothetical protein UV33_C0018G0005 [Candidatus Daviesbacteria bacterium GW2011_GWA1_42_6]